MKVTLRKLERKSEDHKKTKALYNSAFPANERAPLWLLSMKSKKDNIDFLGIYKDNVWVGLFYIVSMNDLSYVFYFAIDKQARGQGTGSAALAALSEKYSDKRLFLAIEQADPKAENYQQRVSRKNFYMRNGFMPLGKKLVEGEVTYEVLGSGGNVSAEEYDKLIESFSGKLLKKLVTMKIVEE